MPIRSFAVLMVLGVLVGGSGEAAAQGAPADRIYLRIGFGVESGSTNSTDTRQYTLYDETATTTTNAPWTSGSFFGDGGFLRDTEAKTDVRLLVSDFDTTVGGIQFGFGARIRF